MLKGISPLLSPELLKILAEMGHGDELVIGDINFPAQSMGQRCVRCDGHGGVELLDAILQLFPLDQFVEAPITVMDPAGGMEGDPPIWAELDRVAQKHQPGVRFEKIIDGMKTYTPDDIESALVRAGFSEVWKAHHPSRPWITVIARK